MIRGTLSQDASPLVQELHAAWAKTGWSISTLLEKSRLDCDRTSLGRKIRGRQGATPDEYHAMARALGRELEWTGKGLRLKKQAA